jgi:hypothetical protein
MESGGRWAVLFSDTAEFIFGDGFFHNYPSSIDGINTGRKCIVPITPTVAVAHILPVSHPSEPRLVTIRLRVDEVEALNLAVQVYSKEFLFFRSQRPSLTAEFACRQFKQYKFHRHRWADALLDDLAQCNQWGPGGTLGRASLRPALCDLDDWMERNEIRRGH